MPTAQLLNCWDFFVYTAIETKKKHLKYYARHVDVITNSIFTCCKSGNEVTCQLIPLPMIVHYIIVVKVKIKFLMKMSKLLRFSCQYKT